mmetsp:Transcript_21622/g.74816  ORF Transcript_21622/g.74816 Transcript_21622/m.74816 type:complete len:270 (+) Transcript_21622:112-921(+)
MAAGHSGVGVFHGAETNRALGCRRRRASSSSGVVGKAGVVAGVVGESRGLRVQFAAESSPGRAPGRVRGRVAAVMGQIEAARLPSRRRGDDLLGEDLMIVENVSKVNQKALPRRHMRVARRRRHRPAQVAARAYKVRCDFDNGHAQEAQAALHEHRHVEQQRRSVPLDAVAPRPVARRGGERGQREQGHARGGGGGGLGHSDLEHQGRAAAADAEGDERRGVDVGADDCDRRREAVPLPRARHGRLEEPGEPAPGERGAEELGTERGES